MSEDGLTKSDIATIFKRLRSVPSNKICFDCGAKNPTWSSVTYGVFICMDCSAVHRSLGVHVSFVRSTQLDTSWTWQQLRAMQVGGNANALSFFQQHNCQTADAQQKYNSRAAQLYREKLYHMACNAMRIHGTKLHIDTSHGDNVPSPEVKEVDFFKEHSEARLCANELSNDDDNEFDGSSNMSSISDKFVDGNESTDIGPSVETLNSSPQPPNEARKSTIVSRKPVAKKGHGAKKGLGAQKVKTDFAEIEREAQQTDQIKERISAKQNVKVSKTQEEKQLASVRLAYQDLSLQKKQTEDKMRQVDPRKAEQLERLGMGFSSSHHGDVSHSAASNMTTIQQENPSSSSGNREKERDFDDDFEFLSFSSGPPKYGDSPFFSHSDDKFSDYFKKGPWQIDNSEGKKSSIETILPLEKDNSSGRNRKEASISSGSDEAQRKFGNAKAISSEQFFNNNFDSEFQRKSNLSRFEGSSSISSADYFGGSSQSSSSDYNTPNIYDIKEGVKDGVTKVATRLSSIANGVMNSLQRK